MEKQQKNRANGRRNAAQSRCILFGFLSNRNTIETLAKESLIFLAGKTYKCLDIVQFCERNARKCVFAANWPATMVDPPAHGQASNRYAPLGDEEMDAEAETGENSGGKGGESEA
jgi:hypothetical protein